VIWPADLDAVEELGLLVLRLDGVHGGVEHLVPDKQTAAIGTPVRFLTNAAESGTGTNRGGGRGFGAYFLRALPTWKLIQKLRKA
jgi:hypothetical protein